MLALNALDKIATTLGFEMRLDHENVYRFTHIESGYVLRAGWTAPWRTDFKTKTITCQHGNSWKTSSAISCEQCVSDEYAETQRVLLTQTAMAVVEEMWGIATTGKPQPLIS